LHRSFTDNTNRKRQTLSHKNIENGSSHCTCDGHLSEAFLGHSYVSGHVSEAVTPSDNGQSKEGKWNARDQLHELKEIDDTVSGSLDPANTLNKSNDCEERNKPWWRSCSLDFHPDEDGQNYSWEQGAARDYNVPLSCI
jgi:hypothetical protein